MGGWTSNGPQKQTNQPKPPNQPTITNPKPNQTKRPLQPKKHNPSVCLEARLWIKAWFVPQQPMHGNSYWCSIQSPMLSIYWNFHMQCNASLKAMCLWGLSGLWGWFGFSFVSSLFDIYSTNPFVWRTSGPSPHKQSALVSVGSVDMFCSMPFWAQINYSVIQSRWPFKAPASLGCICLKHSRVEYTYLYVNKLTKALQNK